MSKVFVVNRGGHNHTDAERFGELIFMSEGTINRYAVSQMYRQFVDHMKDSTEDDFILLTGLSVMASVACSVFARIHGRLNLLLFKSSQSGEEGRYVERTVMLDELL